MSEDRIIKALLNKIKAIILVSFIITGATAVYNFYVVHPVYQASVILYSIGSVSNGEGTVITSDSIAVGQQMVKDYGQIIKSDEVTAAVIKNLGLKDMTMDKLSKDVSLVIGDDSNLMTLSVNNTDPEKAQKIANAFAQVFVQKVMGITKQINVSIVQNAKVPTSPISPNKTKNVTLALLISLLGTSGVVVIMEFLDNTAHTFEDIEDELGYNVIGIIPKLNIK